MPTKIQIKRGLSANIAALTLATGELAFVTDTGKLYIGNGAAKTLINPMGPPTGISTTISYPKVRVNVHGQVIAQETLTAGDIPNIPSTNVTGLGTCSVINTGTAMGQIPTLEPSGKFPIGTLPGLNYAHIYNATANTTVAPNQIISLTTGILFSTDFAVNGDGSIALKTAGMYLINYYANFNSADATTLLYSPTYNSNWPGTTCRVTNSSATPYVSCSGTMLRNIGAPESVAIRNIGVGNLVALGSSCGMTIVKIV